MKMSGKKLVQLLFLSRCSMLDPEWESEKMQHITVISFSTSIFSGWHRLCMCLLLYGKKIRFHRTEGVDQTKNWRGLKWFSKVEDM